MLCSDPSLACQLQHSVFGREEERTIADRMVHNGEIPCDLLDFDKIPPNNSFLNSYRDTQPVYFLWSGRCCFLSSSFSYLYSIHTQPFSLFHLFLSKFHDLRESARAQTHLVFAHSWCVCSSVLYYDGEVMWTRACEMRTRTHTYLTYRQFTK